MKTQIVQIAVSVIVRDPTRTKILMGRKVKPPRKDHWIVPGGKLDWGETVSSCGEREVIEETGILIRDLKHLPSLNGEPQFTQELVRTNKEVNHFVNFWMFADLDYAQTPITREPNKHADWGWFDITNLPDPVWGPIREVLLQMQQQGSLNNSITRYE